MSNHIHKHDYSLIYKFIVDYKRAHDGVSPTIREISAACKISSISHTYYILRSLCAEGKLRLNGGNTSRNIEVVGGQWLPPG